MPIFQGAMRGRLLFGIDDRLLFLSVLFILLGMWRWPFWALLIPYLAIARYAGAKSPFAVDDFLSYVDARMNCPGGIMPDDIPFSKDPESMRQFKRLKT